MKKMKLFIGTLAIALGAAGAFATHATNNHLKLQDDPALYWFDQEDGNGASSVNSTPQTAADRIAATGCDGASQFCENGYSGTQLNTLNNPSSGVKATTPAQTPQGQIFLHE